MTIFDSIRELLTQQVNSQPDVSDSAPELDAAIRQQAEDLLTGCISGDWIGHHLRPEVAAKREENRRAVLSGDLEFKRVFVQVVFERSMRECVLPANPDYKAALALRTLMSQLYRYRIPYSDRVIQWMIQALASSRRGWHRLDYAGVDLKGLLRSISKVTDGRQWSSDMRQALGQLKQQIADGQSSAACRDTLEIIDSMLGISKPLILVDTSDDWGFFADEALAELDPDVSEHWQEFLRFAATIQGSKPNKKWLAQARLHIDAIGSDQFERIAIDWLRLLNRPTRNIGYRHTSGYTLPTLFLADRNGDVLKGLAWSCSLLESEAICSALGDAGIAAFKKIPQIGSRSVKAGNACVWALAAMPGMAPVAQLQRLKEQLKQPSARKQAESALEAASRRLGLAREDLEELMVPDFGLKDGEARTQLGEWWAVLTLSLPGKIDLGWRRNDSERTQKSVPADVTRDSSDDAKLLKRTVKDLRTALQTQQSRIERLFLIDRRWTCADWQTRYLDHGLVSYLSRRLIWTFTAGDRQEQGLWLNGQIVDVRDEPIDWIDAETEVRLWHPIDSDAEHVLNWRQWLERHQITQPFKQAHREIYVLTDAERETEIYSNRFAAHIVRQHQLHALCQQRGWEYRLQGGFDGANTPELDLPQYGLQVGYWVDTPDPGNAPMAGSGIFLYVATDQVRFTRRDGLLEAVPLSDIPTRVFTEVMRDVDLFVGVCSIGNDPNWVDQGQARPYQAYWWNYSFGELSASAETRRSVLEGLLPHLAKLKGRWELSDRFLVVRGDLRTYKIHLGSGNILMEPNDQYLCIVPGRGADPVGSGKLFLPFEGDSVLWVILSKALMLADDRNIKDPTITRQLAVREQPAIAAE
jgi:hypothetical protein